MDSIEPAEVVVTCSWCNGPSRVIHCGCTGGALVRMHCDLWQEIGFKRRRWPVDPREKTWPLHFQLMYPKPARERGERPDPWPAEGAA